MTGKGDMNYLKEELDKLIVELSTLVKQCSEGSEMSVRLEGALATARDTREALEQKGTEPSSKKKKEWYEAIVYLVKLTFDIARNLLE